MSPAGAIDFTVGETVSQNLFKTASGDIATITGRVVSVDTSNSKIIVDTIRPDHTAMKQLQSEDGSLVSIVCLRKHMVTGKQTNQIQT